MIQELQIKNFRNLASLNLNFKDKTTIITGHNDLGKSNALNALCWMTTGTILTDKWGFGENDIDSIIPKNAVRGINPEVSVITNKGTKFTKKYISQYSKDGSKVKGHTTEWYINDVACKNETEFNEQFYEALGYTSKLKTKEVNELRLFIDPLYALQKLDAKQLRQLLVELGCSVTPEELYQKGFGDLKPYGDKYLNKWDVMRKDLKEQSKVLTKEIENIQAKLETVTTIEDYNPDTIKELQKEYETLIAKKSAIQTGATNPLVIDFEKKIEAIQAAITTRIQEHKNGVAEKRKMLEEQKAYELEKATLGIRKELQPLYDERDRLVDECTKMESSIQSYNLTAQTQSKLMQQYITLAKSLGEKKTDLSVKLETVRGSQYKGMITCPICGSDFPASEEDQRNFETHKQMEINSLIQEIAKLEKDKASYKEEYDNAKALRDEALQTCDECKVNYNVAFQKKTELEAKCHELEAKPIDKSGIEEIDKKIIALDLPIDYSKEYQELESLKLKVESLKQSDAAKVQDQVNEIEMEIIALNSKISDEYVKQSKYKEKTEYEAKLGATQAKLNDLECLLARCNRLIQTMISLINQKATEKTGLTFVMLEENLTNDGIKEVCYATVDDIPFKDVNTAKKIKYGIKFIEKLKELLGHNQFPILADRLEGIDSIETIKNMTQEQLICTRVSEAKNITII